MFPTAATNCPRFTTSPAFTQQLEGIGAPTRSLLPANRLPNGREKLGLRTSPVRRSHDVAVPNVNREFESAAGFIGCGRWAKSLEQRRSEM